MRMVTSMIHRLEDCQVVRLQEEIRASDPRDAIECDFVAGGRGVLSQGEMLFRGSLDGLTERPPKNAISVVVKPEPEWTEIEITVDSGACDTVMPSKMCGHISILSTEKSRSGYEYEVANGEGLPNHGERRCFMMTENSETMKRIAFQCADVHKALLSVSRLADQGYQCLLGQHGGELRDVVTGDVIPLHRRDNLYVMRAWVRQDESGFARQE